MQELPNPHGGTGLKEQLLQLIADYALENEAPNQAENRGKAESPVQ